MAASLWPFCVRKAWTEAREAATLVLVGASRAVVFAALEDFLSPEAFLDDFLSVAMVGDRIVGLRERCAGVW